MLHKDVGAMDRAGFILKILIFMLLWVHGGDNQYRRGHSVEENNNKETIHVGGKVQ